MFDEPKPPKPEFVLLFVEPKPPNPPPKAIVCKEENACVKDSCDPIASRELYRFAEKQYESVNARDHDTRQEGVRVALSISGATKD